ncbi:hypothetical protein ABIE85_006966 [Bradyrhizobium diazoefficiens]
MQISNIYLKLFTIPYETEARNPQRVEFGAASPSSLRAQRSNPDCRRGKILDCFAALAIEFAALPRSDLRDDPARGHLLTLGDVDRGDHAVDAGLVDVLHFHRFQRQHRLAGGDAVARLDQDGDDAAVHGGADFSVAAVGCRRLWRSESEVGHRERKAAMLEIEPIAIAQEFGAVHHTVVTEADPVRIELINFELVLPAVGGDGVPTIPLSRNFEFARLAGDLDIRRKRKRCRQAPAAPP